MSELGPMWPEDHKEIYYPQGKGEFDLFLGLEPKTHRSHWYAVLGPYPNAV